MAGWVIRRLVCWIGTAIPVASAWSARAEEPKSATPVYIKREVENFDGFGGYKAKDAAWTPRMAWYPHWSRGGDSGWWGAQGRADADDGEEVFLGFTVPQSDSYTLWVRYEDYIGKPEPFEVIIAHAGGEAGGSFGARDVAAAEPPFPWTYAWDKRTVSLKKGPARVRVALTAGAPVRRALDAIVLTTDAQWTPKDRGFPPLAYSTYLARWAENRTPLKPLVASKRPGGVPAAWKLPVTAGRDFWYLGAQRLVPGFPLPITVEPEPNRQGYIKAWSGKADTAPIFSSPACAIRVGIGHVKELLDPSNALRRYILENKRPFVLAGNYNSAGKIKGSYQEIRKVFGALWLGIISGENSYLYVLHLPKDAAPGPGFKDANYQWLFQEGRQRWKKALGNDWASTIENPFEKYTLCASCSTFPFIHRLSEAGSTVLGTEGAAALPYQQCQLAFARGAARQYGARSLWYYGASFGDSIRTFTRESPYVLKLEGMEVDNRNATIGPSLAHIRRTLLHAYLQGMSFLYPEQGYNLFDTDGQLNPMGWCYDETVRLATRHPDRGVTDTPIAVLLDKAHGWDKYDYVGSRIWSKQPMKPWDRMISEFLNVAYFPFPRNEGDPVDDLNVPWPNGVFGDIFDVLVTSPTRLDAIQAYPVLFCVGATRLDAKWADALKGYVSAGGTLVINAAQLVPALGEGFLGAKVAKERKEASRVQCLRDGETLAGTLFSYPAVEPTTAQVIAKTETGDPVALVNRVGKGQVVLTTPEWLLGQDGHATPYLAHLLLELASGLLPVEVRGNCQFHVNRHPRGYVVVLSHNEGICKMSHSAARMDAAKTAVVKLAMADRPLATEDWLGEQPQPWSFPNEWVPEYTQPVKLEWKQQDGSWHSEITLRPGEVRVFLVRAN